MNYPSRLMIAMRFVVAVVILAGFCRSTNAQSLFSLSELGRRSRTVHVIHYALNVRFDTKLKQVLGKTSITFTPLRDRLDSVVFDASDMQIAGITGKKGDSLRFTNRSPFLGIHLASPAHWGDTVTVVIDYSCIPKKGLYFIEPDSAHPQRHNQIWTQGEDMDNHHWFPCYDFPNEKSTSEIIAVVPDNWTLVSNGVLVKETRDARKRTRTFHWRQSKPHSSYLIMLAAGEYAVLHDRVGSLPLTYYVYREDSTKARAVFGDTPSMVRFFEEKIGVPYPWDKFAQIIIDEFMYGGMENTTVVTLNTATMLDRRAQLDGSSHDVIAHELAHQWWGDLVTCRDWSIIWLNEGFATYFEQLYSGYRLGPDEFEYQRVARSVESRGTDLMHGRKPIVSEGSYISNVYGRAGWVLHMLHDLVGEEGFWKSLRLYISRSAFRNADTHELALAFEDATGRNLGWFFEQWIYGAGFPSLDVRKTWNDTTHFETLVLTQTQKTDSLTGIFQFPLHLSLTNASRTIDTTVWISRKSDTVLIASTEKPLMVIVDKGYHLLKELNFEKEKDEYIYQLAHASDISDRMNAARELRDYFDEPGAFAAVREAALHDPFWAVRNYAISSLGTSKADSARDAILSTCVDRDARVRASAARELEKYRGSEAAKVLERMALTDSSYAVIAAALHSLVRHDSSGACTVALSLVDQPSLRNAVRSSALRALARARDPRALAAGVRYAAVGNEIGIRQSSLAILGHSGNGNAQAQAMLRRSLNDDIADIRMSAVKALSGWNTDESRALLQQRASVETDPTVKALIEESGK